MTWEDWHVDSKEEAEYLGIKETYHLQPCAICGQETTFVEIKMRRPICGPQCWVRE